MKDILVETLKCQLSLVELQIQADRWPVGTKDPKTGEGIGGQFKPTGGASGSVKSKEIEDKETRDFIAKYNEQKNNTSAQDEAAFKEFQANNQAKFFLLNTSHVAARIYEQMIPLNTDVPFLESFQKVIAKVTKQKPKQDIIAFRGISDIVDTITNGEIILQKISDFGKKLYDETKAELEKDGKKIYDKIYKESPKNIQLQLDKAEKGIIGFKKYLDRAKGEIASQFAPVKKDIDSEIKKAQQKIEADMIDYIDKEVPDDFLPGIAVGLMTLGFYMHENNYGSETRDKIYSLESKVIEEYKKQIDRKAEAIKSGDLKLEDYRTQRKKDVEKVIRDKIDELRNDPKHTTVHYENGNKITITVL